ncbi:MAG: hypothetical protein ACR2GU_01485 [Rubrobacteraceae bacterium]
MISNLFGGLKDRLGRGPVSAAGLATLQASPGEVANAASLSGLKDSKRWLLGLAVIIGTFAAAGLMLWKLPMKRF